MSIIDAHHHLWDLGQRDYAWLGAPANQPIRRDFGVPDLRAAVANQDVAATVVVQAVDTLEETRALLDIAARTPLIAGVVGWVDLTEPDVAQQIASLRAGPGGDLLVGIRHGVQAETDAAWLARPDVLRGLATLARAGLVYDLLTVPRQLPAALTAVLEVPQLGFVVDHLSKPPIAAGDLQPWATRLHALAAEPNVVCKLSGMVTEAGPQWTVEQLRPFANTAIEAFGPDRLMFGSDWPVCTLASSYDRVVEAAGELTAELDAEQRAQVFAGTARRVYRLPRERAE